MQIDDKHVYIWKDGYIMDIWMNGWLDTYVKQTKRQTEGQMNK